LLWGIPVIACVVILVCWQMAVRRRVNEEPVASDGLFELVEIGADVGQIPERFRFVGCYMLVHGNGRGSLFVKIKVNDQREPYVLRPGADIRLHALKLGEDIPGTEFKVASFSHKIEERDDDQRHDASTVTIVNKETGAEEVLPLRDENYRGDLRAHFRGRAAQPAGQAVAGFSARIGETFTFPPESGKTFRVLDIKGRGAVIRRPDGKKMLLIVQK